MYKAAWRRTTHGWRVRRVHLVRHECALPANKELIHAKAKYTHTIQTAFASITRNYPQMWSHQYNQVLLANAVSPANAVLPVCITRFYQQCGVEYLDFGHEV